MTRSGVDSACGSVDNGANHHHEDTAVNPALICTLFLALTLVHSPSLAQEAGDSVAPDTASEPAPIPEIRFRKVFRGQEWKRPIQLIPRPGSDRYLYVAEQRGRVRVVDLESAEGPAEVVLDITDRVYQRHNEEGLLSIAFAPDYPESRHLYTWYSAKKPRRGVLSRFTVSEGDNPKIDPASEEVILEVGQPWGNHNGGTVAFGPDDMLYLSIGDGGAADDPRGFGQDLSSLLGTVIRIDPRTPSGDKAYTIPADNPFIDREGARPEIWAYGLRNVWRMSFDSKTGDLWGGDVGQNAWEEIDLIRSGGNYGWKPMEGTRPFSRYRGDKEPADPYIPPVVEYPRREGISVTGGNVYRGDSIPGLDGVYLYADYAYGTVWGIRYIDGKATKPKILKRAGRSLVSSFGEANDGTLYMMTFDGGEWGPGSIWRIDKR